MHVNWLMHAFAQIPGTSCSLCTRTWADLATAAGTYESGLALDALTSLAINAEVAGAKQGNVEHSTHYREILQKVIQLVRVARGIGSPERMKQGCHWDQEKEYGCCGKARFIAENKG
jgi:hypothetical protein